MKNLLFLLILCLPGLVDTVNAQCTPNGYGVNNFVVNDPQSNSLCLPSCTYANPRYFLIRCASPYICSHIHVSGDNTFPFTVMVTDTNCSGMLYVNCSVGGSVFQEMNTGALQFNILVITDGVRTIFNGTTASANPLPFLGSEACSSVGIDEPIEPESSCEGTGYTDIMGRRFEIRPSGLVYDHSKCAWTTQ